jgi:hypothetical protein
MLEKVCRNPINDVERETQTNSLHVRSSTSWFVKNHDRPEPNKRLNITARLVFVLSFDLQPRLDANLSGPANDKRIDIVAAISPHAPLISRFDLPIPTLDNG